MTFASVSAVTVTLLLGRRIFSILMMNLNHIADNVENDVEIKVMLTLQLTSEDENSNGRKLMQFRS